MRFSTRKLIFTLFLIFSLITPNFNAYAASKSGTKCSKVNATTIVSGYKYTCVKFGNKLIWDSGTKIAGKTIVTGPAVGDCYDYTFEETIPKYIVSPKVSCAGMHSAETYVFTNWPSEINPYLETDDNILKIVRPICANKPGEGTIINSYVFSFSSQADWDKGTRWIRCEAVSFDNVYKPTSLVRWSNKPPIQPFVPASCTVESAKSKWWRTGEYGGQSFGFYVRNTSPNRDATQVVITINYVDGDGVSRRELVEISRIPAGQMLGSGRIIGTSSQFRSWSYSIRCLDSARSNVQQIISGSGALSPDPDNSSGLIYRATGVNSYRDVIRCKNDGYSCLVYILLFDSAGGMVAGDFTSISGPVYPGDTMDIYGQIPDYPRSYYPMNLASFKYWIQEPQ